MGWLEDGWEPLIHIMAAFSKKKQSQQNNQLIYSAIDKKNAGHL